MRKRDCAFLAYIYRLAMQLPPSELNEHTYVF